MSLNEILGSALSGLNASQAGLRTVSNNIANVGTPGYARERVTLSTGVTSGRVNGVIAGEPSRIADRFLEGNVYRRSGDTGRAEVTSTYLDRLQGLIGKPGAEGLLPSRLDAITASATAMTAAAGSPETVAAFTGNVQDTIQSLQQLSSDVDGLRADVESEVSYTVDRINSLLTRIHDLNDTVSSLQGLGRSAAGAADQRMSAIQELSSLMKVTIRDQPDGRVSIDTASGSPLLDRRLRLLSYPMPGEGVSQPTYPTIDLRFADANGQPGPATGDRLDSPSIGGRLGGLLELRDSTLPNFSEKLGVLFGGLAETLNAVSNAGTSVPPPNQLAGGQTALIGSDRLGFTGAATFAVTKADGTLVQSTKIDFTGLGPNATVDDAVAAINAGLAGAGTATFTNGRLTIQANDAGNGVAVAQDEANPSARAGLGFSQVFGLNDMVANDQGPIGPSGFAATDAHGFAQGATAEIVLRDPSGRTLGRYTLTGSSGPTFGDLVNELNGSPLAQFGKFSLDDRGRMRFDPVSSAAGATISIPSDSTDRFGTGRSFSSISGLTGAANGLATGTVRQEIQVNPGRLPLARLQTDATVGSKALGANDTRGATAFVSQLGKPVDLGKDGVVTTERFSTLFLGKVSTQASQAQSAFSDANARLDDAVSRRDNFSGVNIDEELAQMVVLQNSYSAAARVMTTANAMYDTLLAMLG